VSFTEEMKNQIISVNRAIFIGLGHACFDVVGPKQDLRDLLN